MTRRSSVIGPARSGPPPVGPPPVGPIGRAGRLATAVLVTIAGAILTGCTASAHPGISSPEVNACYRAIPPARAAVHDAHATLIGVHRLAADDLPRRLPSATLAIASDDEALCAVALKGNFSPGQVDLAPPGQTGRYAVVLVAYSRLQVLGAVVLAQLPRSFGARTV